MRTIWLVIATTLAIFSGCSGVQVNQDYDPATSFTSMSTYDWATATQEKTGDPRIDNPLRDTRIRTAVERQLQDKGYVKATGDPPTFLVRYQYVLRQKIESDGSGIGFGVGSYGRHGGIAIGTGNSIREYEEGALVIDFADPQSESLIWRGTGNQRFKMYDDPQKAKQEIDMLVEKIMAQFPPTTQ